MTLTQDVYTLVVEGYRYSANWETLAELPHFLHDLTLGATRKEKSPHRCYTDLHTHIRADVSICDVIEEASKRVDILNIVTRTRESNDGHLSFDKAVEKLEQEKVEHELIGTRIAQVKGERPFYLLRGTEIYVKERQGIVMAGTDKEFDENEFYLGEAISACKDMGSFWFLDHPFSIGAPVIAFRYPTKDEMKMRRRWFDTYRPVIETGNHQNTLWMYPSNVLARRMARKHDLVGISNSDTHFRLQDIGLSRSSFPKDLLDDSSEEAFFSSLQQAFSPEFRDELKIESGYASIWSFGKYMILPHIPWVLGMKQ
ncbi:MAG: hypothetical protein CMH61_02850 [Nanoarchaeota archaeon]|nr:hypothetical protein [Nanoarchaeota archaeon]|tara:strand:+ start:951 stop:1889 length:939 start_codon:yes stop_codon:yes gene_type:complete